MEGKTMTDKEIPKSEDCKARASRKMRDVDQIQQLVGND